MATTLIKADRLTLSALTTDPTSCAAGDMWFRSDLGKSKWAIDTVVANAKTMAVTPLGTTDLADSAVTTAKIADSNVTNAKLQYSSVSVPAGTGLTGGGAVSLGGTATSIGIAAGGVGTTQLADSGVTTAKIADSQVTSGKIADSAVATAKIADSAVTTAKIADSQVTTAKIADSAVSNAKIASGVDPGKITTGNMNLGTGTLTAGQVSVGDIVLRFGWRIAETPDALLFIKDGEVVGRVGKAGFSHT